MIINEARSKVVKKTERLHLVFSVLRKAFNTIVHFNLDQRPIKMLQWYMPEE
jgi:hypothetical protein